MLYICITFDYELYMGKNNVSLEDVLIAPTYELLEMLDKNNVKCTLFADVCCPMVLERQNKQQKLTLAIKKQLQNALIRKHDVQLHIHPHWLKTEYDEGTGELHFNKKYYRLHEFENESESINDIVKKGVEFLKQTLLPVDSKYQCIAYRAGGFSIQPEKQIIDVLLRNGIKIDSSVAEKCKYLGKNMRYDFGFCNSNHNYYIDKHWGFKKRYNKAKTNCLYEVPIGTCSIPIIKNIIAKKYNCEFAEVKRGCGMDISNEISKKRFNLIQRLFGNAAMCTVDFLRWRVLYKYLMFYVKNSKLRKKDIYISIIGHPKGLDQQRICNLETLINELKKRNDVQFVTMREICDKLEL